MKTALETIIKILFLIAVASILIVCITIFVAFGGGGLLAPNPPEPEITYGEFPIRIVFEINGEKKTVEDTVICEYDGFKILGEAGKYRQWKAHLASGSERLTLLKIDDISELYCWYGSPEYYMDDLLFDSSREDYEKLLEKNSLGLVSWADGKLQGTVISRDEAEETYGLTIIDIQYSKPIVNSYPED